MKKYPICEDCGKRHKPNLATAKQRTQVLDMLANALETIKWKNKQPIN